MVILARIMEKLQSYFWRVSPLHAGMLTVVLLLLVRWFSGFDGLYGQDAYAYLSYAQEIRNHWEGGAFPRSFFWPEVFPTLGSLLSYLTGNLGLALQLVSIFSAGATVYFAGSTLSKSKPQGLPAPWIAFILLGASPFLFRMALTCMSDALAVAAISACIHQCYAFREHSNSQAVLAAVFAGSLAVFTRYAALFLVAPLLVFLLIQILNKRKHSTLLLAILGGLPPLLLHFWLSDSTLPTHHFLQDWSLGNFFQSEFEMLDGSFKYGQINLIAVLKPFYHPGFLGVGTLLVLFGMLRLPQMIKRWGFPLVAVPIYLIFLAGIPFQNDRFGLLLLPFLLLLFPENLPSRLWHRLAKYRLLLLLVVLLVQGFLVQWALRPRIEDNRRDRMISERLCQKAPATVYTFGIDGALRNRCPEIAVINLWDRPLEQVNQQELVLFNFQAFAEQWKGKTVMNNWEFLDAQYNLVPIDSFSAGWTLYEIR